MTEIQVEIIAEALSDETSSIVSVFARRIADTERDLGPIIKICKDILIGKPAAQLLWASQREMLNLFQTDTVGYNIITVTNDLLKKLAGIDRDLDAFSPETVKMFFDDATSAGYDIVVE